LGCTIGFEETDRSRGNAGKSTQSELGSRPIRAGPALPHTRPPPITRFELYAALISRHLRPRRPIRLPFRCYDLPRRHLTRMTKFPQPRSLSGEKFALCVTLLQLFPHKFTLCVTHGSKERKHMPCKSRSTAFRPRSASTTALFVICVTLHVRRPAQLRPDPQCDVISGSGVQSRQWPKSSVDPPRSRRGREC
jgi:hypothetical protein